MRKKILISLGVFVLIVAFAFVYLNNRNRTLSPPGEALAEMDDFSVLVEYSRPSVRGRLIFGPESKEALQPFEKYWRLGANEPTRVTVNKDFFFGDKQVAAGKYDMYAVPGEQQFKLALNTGNRFWGVTEPDYEEDVASVFVPVQKSKIKVEQFSITAVEEDSSIKLVFMWDDWLWEVKLTPR